MGSYAVSLTSNGGLTFVTSSGGEGAGTTKITGASTTGVTSLATYTLRAPTVTSDTTYSVGFSASDMETPELEPVSNSSATATITVKATATTPTTPTTTPTTTTTTTKSTDSSLKALAAAEGTITPAFSKDVKAYTLNVATEITEVNVSATVNNSRATYTVVGNKDLKEGENLVTVTVKAENRNNYSLYN